VARQVRIVSGVVAEHVPHNDLAGRGRAPASFHFVVEEVARQHIAVDLCTHEQHLVGIRCAHRRNDVTRLCEPERLRPHVRVARQHGLSVVRGISLLRVDGRRSFTTFHAKLPFKKGKCSILPALFGIWIYHCQRHCLLTFAEVPTREIEVEENDDRKDFTAGERGRTLRAVKQTVADVKKATEIILAKTAKKEKDPRGRVAMVSSSGLVAGDTEVGECGRDRSTLTVLRFLVAEVVSSDFGYLHEASATARTDREPIPRVSSLGIIVGASDDDFPIAAADLPRPKGANVNLHPQYAGVEAQQEQEERANMKRAVIVGAVACGFILGAVVGHLTPAHAQFDSGKGKVYINEDRSPGFGSGQVPVAITGSQVVGFSCVVEKDDSEKCYVASK
jgi:hypothetical protein